MIFYLLLVFLFIGLILFALGRYGSRLDDCDFNEKKTIKDKIKFFLYLNDCELAKTGCYDVIVSLGLIIILAIVVASNHVDAGPTSAKLEETYNALLFKAESDFAKDELGLLNKEIVDEIQSWNEDVSYYQKSRENKWFGVLITPAYDDLEKIDLQKFNSNE